MRCGCFIVTAGVALSIGASSASAQIAVTDPATTARNAVTAALKSRVLELLRVQDERLRNMARRLSADTSLDTYVLADPPRSRTYAPASEYARGYEEALLAGDPLGAEYTRVSRSRQLATDLLGSLNPIAREIVTRALATIDAADSTLILSTHQAGLLRSAGQLETVAIDRLEADVLDPSQGAERHRGARQDQCGPSDRGPPETGAPRVAHWHRRPASGREQTCTRCESAGLTCVGTPRVADWAARRSFLPVRNDCGVGARG